MGLSKQRTRRNRRMLCIGIVIGTLAIGVAGCNPSSAGRALAKGAGAGAGGGCTLKCK